MGEDVYLLIWSLPDKRRFSQQARLVRSMIGRTLDCANNNLQWNMQRSTTNSNDNDFSLKPKHEFFCPELSLLSTFLLNWLSHQLGQKIRIALSVFSMIDWLSAFCLFRNNLNWCHLDCKLQYHSGGLSNSCDVFIHTLPIQWIPAIACTKRWCIWPILKR